MNCDVCVIGAGPSGLTAAIAALDEGRTVTVVATPSRRRSGPLELLSGKAGHIMRQLTASDAPYYDAVACVGSVSRWAARGFVEHSSMLDQYGGGWIVDRAGFDETLAAIAVARGATRVCDRVTGIDPPNLVQLQNGSIQADRIVIATGRAGSGSLCDGLRRHAGNHMIALSVEVGPGAVSGLGHQLLIDRAPNGWWYALANEYKTSIVYCTDPTVLRESGGGVQAAWVDGCRSAREWLPGDVETLRPRGRVASVATVMPPACDNVRMVGDAAMSADPLSGSGLMFALESGTRWDDRGYTDWVSEMQRRNNTVERETYNAAIGSVGGLFWRARRG